MAVVLADTSVWIAYLRDDRRIRPRAKALLDEQRLLVCGPVVAELLAGVRGTSRETLWQSLVALPWAALDAEAWRLAGEALGELVSKGRRVPLTDVAIGVAAARAGARLWTLDSDFARVAEVVAGLELLDPS